MAVLVAVGVEEGSDVPVDRAQVLVRRAGVSEDSDELVDGVERRGRRDPLSRVDAWFVKRSRSA